MNNTNRIYNEVIVEIINISENNEHFRACIIGNAGSRCS